MLTTNDRLLIGLKVLDRLRLGLHTGWEQTSDILRSSAAGLWTVKDSQPSTRLGAQAGQSEFLSWPPSLENLLTQTGELSSHSVILGLCEDGLPFLLDLTNPAPGAILIAGDSGSGKTRLLRSILASGVYLNQPEHFSYNLATPKVDGLPPFGHPVYIQQALDFDEEGMSDMIHRLADLAEQRQRNKPGQPAIILAIDDLYTCLQYLDESAFSRLYWLIKHGQRSYIWTIATLTACHVDYIHPRLLAAFRTRLIGSIRRRKLAEFISNDKFKATQGLESGAQFCVPYGESWSPFWICDPDSDDQSLDSGKAFSPTALQKEKIK